MTTASSVVSAEPGFGRLEPLVESFDAAVQAAGAVEERDVWLAGEVVRIRSPYPEMLQRLCRAFAHLALPEPAPSPALVVNLWDAASGAPAPPLPHTSGDEPPGAFFYCRTDELRAAFRLGTSGDPRLLAIYPDAPTPALSVLEHGSRRAWYWVADAQRIPYWEQSTPLLYLLDWWLRERGMQLLHAAAVGTAAGGVLLVGKGGSGKSTVALSVLGTEPEVAGGDLLYASDDYVAVSGGAEPAVYSLYNSGKLMQDHVERLPFLLDALANADRLAFEKAVVYVHERWPGKVTAGFPLRAIVLPRVTPGLGEARFHEASPAAAFRALVPSTVFQMHTRGQDSLVRARRLLERVPSYLLELGSDFESIPRAVAGLLATLGGGG
ncbi:MAG TPA: hypothetical protein VE995_00075 [Gaiellaceae bacterium]|nr:hypothetical protein [Gaiellaceae bacterium]